MTRSTNVDTWAVFDLLLKNIPSSGAVVPSEKRHTQSMLVFVKAQACFIKLTQRDMRGFVQYMTISSYRHQSIIAYIHQLKIQSTTAP